MITRDMEDFLEEIAASVYTRDGRRGQFVPFHRLSERFDMLELEDGERRLLFRNQGRPHTFRMDGKDHPLDIVEMTP